MTIKLTKDDELCEVMRSRLTRRLNTHESCFGVDGNGGDDTAFQFRTVRGVGSIRGMRDRNDPRSPSATTRGGWDRSELLPVLRLLDKKADPSVKDTLGSTPLQYATQKGHLEVVRLLLEEQLNRFVLCFT